MSVQERIRKIADELFNGNISAFCRAVDVKQPTMNTILGERQSKPSYDVLSSIVNAEALNISAQWLLTGKGEMFKSSSPKEELTPSPTNACSLSLKVSKEPLRTFQRNKFTKHISLQDVILYMKKH